MDKFVLKTELDNFFGMESSRFQKNNNSDDLLYKSPAGILLFKIHIFNDGYTWKFGGMTGIDSSIWRILCLINEKK